MLRIQVDELVDCEGRVVELTRVMLCGLGLFRGWVLTGSEGYW